MSYLDMYLQILQSWGKKMKAFCLCGAKKLNAIWEKKEEERKPTMTEGNHQ